MGTGYCGRTAGDPEGKNYSEDGQGTGVALLACGVAGGLASAVALARRREAVTLIRACAGASADGAGLLLQP